MYRPIGRCVVRQFADWDEGIVAVDRDQETGRLGTHTIAQGRIPRAMRSSIWGQFARLILRRDCDPDDIRRFLVIEAIVVKEPIVVCIHDLRYVALSIRARIGI